MVLGGAMMLCSNCAGFIHNGWSRRLKEETTSERKLSSIPGRRPCTSGPALSACYCSGRTPVGLESVDEHLT